MGEFCLQTIIINIILQLNNFSMECHPQGAFKDICLQNLVIAFLMEAVGVQFPLQKAWRARHSVRPAQSTLVLRSMQMLGGAFSHCRSWEALSVDTLLHFHPWPEPQRLFYYILTPFRQSRWNFLWSINLIMFDPQCFTFRALFIV